MIFTFQRKLRPLIAIAAVMVAAIAFAPFSVAQAHHSFAKFDRDKERTLTGTVVSFEWGNPHGYLNLSVKTKSGREQVWRIEFGGVNMMTRAGWKKDTFFPGQKVIVKVNPLRNGTTGGKIISATDEDGKLLGKRGH